MPVQALRHDQAGIEQSNWQVNVSRIRCQLSHKIPDYGEGYFVLNAGGEMSFLTQLLMPIRLDGVVNVTSVSPFWRPSQTKELGQTVLSSGHRPMHIMGGLANRLLDELSIGMHPVFTYIDSLNHPSNVAVSLSSVRFKDQLKDFLACVDNMIPYGVEAIKPATINFKTNKYRLTASAKQELEALALFASEDNKIKILVEGYTDSKGSRRYNLNLSKRRTRAVLDYLLAKGVSSDQVTLHSYGEKRPESSNKKYMGRAFNRRVVVSFNRA